MRILVTGSVGFIGNAITLKLLEMGNEIIGIDNHNDYYDPKLKEARLQRLTKYKSDKKYTHLKIDLANRQDIADCFSEYQPEKVVHLGAQAGVRYSIENPQAYVDSNLVGFMNVLEGCRQQKIQHLVYASTSSVYGANSTMPFSEAQNVDHPLSLYAATKKANEAMAHSYSHLYRLPTTGLRFFTVYGPWGRPDMALFKFTKAILSDEEIPVFNYGKHRRDFTFIDDIVEGVIKVLDKPAQANKQWDSAKPTPCSSNAPWRVYNIGNNKPVELLDYIHALEKALGKPAKMKMLPRQDGDLIYTYADVSRLADDFNYHPQTNIEDGVVKFVSWYKEFYKISI